MSASGFLLAALGGMLAPDLARHLGRVPRDEPVAVLVAFEDPLEGAALERAAAGLARRERAPFVRASLVERARRAQEPFERWLRGPDGVDTARERVLWIANARALTLPAGRVAALAARPGVRTVTWDRPLGPAELADVGPEGSTAAPRADGRRGGRRAGSTARATPNVVGHGATALWDLGLDGGGVLCLLVDGGVARDHPDLAGAIWANPREVPGNGVDDDGNGFVDDTWGWDFADDDADPYDTGHGSSVAGILCGDGTANAGVATGMAPGVSLAVARTASAGDLLAAYQYAIAIGADCVSSSYSVKWSARPDQHAFRAAMEAELAAGIVHVNSIGNSGAKLAGEPLPWNVSTPGNCPGPWVHPAQARGGRAAVVAAGGIELGGDALYAEGSRGPSAWEDVRASDPSYPYAQRPAYWDYPWTGGAAPGLLKPDLAAYTGVFTTRGAGGYVRTFWGTSAAAPHVAGAFCLLLQQNPNALPRQLSQAAQETALDLGAAGKDPLTGAGKLRAYEAALLLRSLVTLVPDDPAPGESFELVLSGPAGVPYTLALGREPGSTPTPFGVTLGIADPVPLVSGVHAGPLSPERYRIAVPANPALAGFELRFQSLADDTRGATGRWLVSVVETLRVR